MTNSQDLCLGCMEVTTQDPCPRCGYQRSATPESPFYLSPGTLLQSQFLIGRVLGAGGFGITYIGYDLNLARKVAIKEYFPSGVAVRVTGMPEVFPHAAKLKADFQWGLERFLDEARIVARFHHMRNIIWVQNYFPAHGTAYMVMEFLDGEDLEKILQRLGKLPMAAVKQVMSPVLQALKTVHADGLMHRDISPDNIYVTEQGELIKLIDFGAARFSLSQQSKNLSVILKPGYAPPEQYESKGNQGPWTDVYACAATIYRALTNVVPPPSYDRLSSDELIPPSQLGSDIHPMQERTLLRALSLRPAERPQSIAEFEEELFGKNRMAPQPSPAPAPAPPEAAPGPVPIFDPIPAPSPLPGPLPSPAPIPPPKPGIPKWLIASAVAVLLLVVLAIWLKSEEDLIHYNTDAVQKTPTPAKSTLEILRFAADPESVNPNSSSKLTWDVKNAVSVKINGTEVDPKSDLIVNPTTTSTYELVAQAANGELDRSSVTITVKPREIPDGTPSPVRINRFAINPSTVSPGQAASIEWEVSGPATRITLEPGGLLLSGNQGSRSLVFRSAGTVTLRVESASGIVEQEAELQFTQPPNAAPRINYFDIRPKSFNRSPRPVTISWNVSGASQIEIDPQPGSSLPSSGERMIEINAPTTFTITAVNSKGQKVSQSIEVKAMASPPGPNPNPGPGPGPDPGEDRLPNPVSKDSWLVVHSHGLALPANINILFGRGGSISTKRPGPDDPCTGYLTLLDGRLRYQPLNNNDGFDVTLSSLKEVKGNVFPIGNYKAFHIKLNSGKTYNFVPPRDNVSTILDTIRGKM